MTGPAVGVSLPPVVAVASRNPGKIREILSICSNWPVEWRTAEQDPAGWPDPEETGATYLENARLKARAVAGALGISALADDSGIEVDALGGAPGPRSARFAGDEADDSANLAKLIGLIRPVPAAGRSARYRCLAVLALPDGGEAYAEGVCEGTLTDEPRGSGGFGYDPIFVPAGKRQTMAELTPEEKDRISHRGRALRALRSRMDRAAGRGGERHAAGAWEDSPVAADVDPAVLRKVTVFSTCTPEQLGHLIEAAATSTHAPGEALTEEGVMGHRFHLILEGEAQAERHGSPVGTVGRGEFVGEIGLLGGGAATATVRCTAPTRCLELRRERFWELLESEPAIALRILEVVCRRLVQELGTSPTLNLPAGR